MATECFAITVRVTPQAPRALPVALGLALLCGVFPSVASAQSSGAPRTGGSGSVVRALDEDNTTPRTMALGGRAEAAAASTGALFANPAGASAMRTYHVDSYLLYDPTIGRFGTGTGVMDSTRSLVSGGLAYVFNTINNANESRTSHDARVAVAVNLGQSFSLGARGRYLNVAGTPNGAPAAPQNQGLQTGAWGGFTFDAGLHVHPMREFSLSVTGYNLNNPDTTAAPISLGGGLSLSPIRELTLVADALVDFRSTNAVRGRYSGGIELFLSGKYAIRGGYLFDDTRGGSQAVTFGVGYIDPAWSVELAMRQAIVPDLQSTMMLSVRYFYQSAQQQAQQAQQTQQSQQSQP